MFTFFVTVSLIGLVSYLVYRQNKKKAAAFYDKADKAVEDQFKKFN